MAAGGSTWTTAGVLSESADNTFTLADTVAGALQPYWRAWWVHTPAGDGTLHLDTNPTAGDDVDTMLFVYTGADEGSAVEVGSDDDSGVGFRSSLDLAVTGGVTYHILVGTFAVDPGDVTAYGLNGAVPPVPPAPVYSIGGRTAPSGGSTVGSAPDAGTPPFVTAGAAGSSGGDFSGPYLWWKFTAPVDGDVLLDAGMSYQLTTHITDDADPRVTIRVYTGPGGATSIDDLTSVGSDTTGAINEVFDAFTQCGVLQATLTAGTVYYVALEERSGSAPAGLVLRVSGYGIVTDWIQAPDQTWVVNSAGVDASVHPPVIPPVPRAFFDARSAPQHQATYQGNYHLDQALGGPNPSDDGDTYDVLWRNARVGQAGADWWSEDPLNPDVDIHASWHGGPGTPVYKDDGRPLAGRSSEFDDFVGVVWNVDKSFPPTSAGYSTWGHCWRYEVTRITRDYLPASAGVDDPTDFPDVPGGFTGSMEYETPDCTLVSLAAAPDERTTVENVNGSCVVYATIVPTLDADGWGPAAFDGAVEGDLHADEWHGGLDKPDSFPGKQDREINPDWGGGGSDWYDLTDLISTALGQEAVDEPAFPYGASTTYPGSLRFVTLPKCLVAGAPDPEPDPDLNLVVGRNRQAIAVQFTARPARHRWIGVPGYTPVTVGRLLPLRNYPRGDALLTSVAPRNYPAPKSSTRTYGQEP